MSKLENTSLLEQARELQEEFQGTHAEKILQKAIDSGDLDELQYQVIKYGAEAAQRHFFEDDMIEANDVY